MRRNYRKGVLSLFLLAVLAGAACQPGATNTNSANTAVTHANLSNVNLVNNNASLANNNMTGENSTVIESREPDQYQATVKIRAESLGDQKATLPGVTAEVARNGADRRMELSIPNGENLIYLERGQQKFLIFPRRGQYAELNRESVGFDIGRMMMPGQIVERVKAQKGVERVGEEQVNGRTVVRYRYGATTQTNTQAGNVDTRSVVLVDTETGLPLLSETVSETQSGNVQGMKGLRVITEMSNIRTTADPNLFTVPTDLKQVDPEQVRQQIALISQAAMAVFGQMVQSGQTPTQQQTQQEMQQQTNTTISPTPVMSPRP